MSEKKRRPEYTRTAASIMMLEILYSRDLVSISELARLLQTNRRNIPEYKKELQYAGYLIDSVPGRYGGYRLVKNALFPSIKLDKEEQGALLRGFDFLLKRNDFLEKEELGKAMAKVSAAIIRDSVKTDTLIANRFPLVMPEKELEERYEAVSLCVAAKRSIEIEYLSMKNEITKRLFHPYRLFVYDSAWCVIGQDEDSDHVIYLKLNRIKRFRITNHKFRIPLTYVESEYLDEYGMKKNGEWYPIKLKITGTYAMLVTERMYGKDQTVETIDRETTLLTCVMQNKERIIKFVLGFGENCTVLEPEWLKDEVAKVAEKIVRLNKNRMLQEAENGTV